MDPKPSSARGQGAAATLSPQQTILGPFGSDPGRRSAPLAPYTWSAGPTFRNDVLDKHTFLWECRNGKRTHILGIWPDLERTLGVAWATEADVIVGEREIEAKVPEKASVDGTRGPLRLYDCENMILKDQRAYLEETRGVVPPYLVVSQVWGEIKEYLALPTIAWPVPISEKKKWDAIQDYCRRERVKWLWMDVLCINQSRGTEAETEKEDEIPKMSYYYRDATACLVVPQNHEPFSPAYAKIMDILSSIADTGAPVEDHAESIWDAIASLEMVLDDAWFWRVWTYQELLLPKKHVPLDGQELSIDDLERCFSWYLKIFRLEMLKKPSGGREYPWIYQDDTGLKIASGKRWGALQGGWGLRAALQRDGYLDLLPAVMANSSKHCRFPVDQLLGVYGLLKEEDRLRTLHEPETPDDTTHRVDGSLSTEDKKPSDATASGASLDQPSAHLSPSRQMARLEWLWKETMVKTVTEGRVWPLLFDAMTADPPRGTNWIPRIVGATGNEVHEVWDQRNPRGVAVTAAGVHLTARVVGRIGGMSASIGDGTGELNKVLACTWTLVAKGFSCRPIMALLEDGLAHSGAVLEEDVQNAQIQLRRALHAPSLAHCFLIIEKMDFRHKLVHARGIAGWNRVVFTAQPGPSYSSADGTYVFLGLVYDHKTPDPGQCWILDVTAGSPDARRWVIANKTGPNTFHKIGSVAATSQTVFTANHVYRRVVLD